MSICGGLVVAGAVDSLQPRAAAAAAAAVFLLVAADGLAVSPPSARAGFPYSLDSRDFIDPLLSSLPKAGSADRPLLDLPPPHQEKENLWWAYSYFQTEHRQKIVWCDIVPDPAPTLMALSTDFHDRLEAYGREPPCGRGSAPRCAAPASRRSFSTGSFSAPGRGPSSRRCWILSSREGRRVRDLAAWEVHPSSATLID